MFNFTFTFNFNFDFFRNFGIDLTRDFLNLHFKILKRLRYFIEIAYNGQNYFGWQSQPNEITVQEVLEDAMFTILREKIKVTGAGRTDTGVHAKQLFAHFDFTEIENIQDIIFRLNCILPKHISVKNIFPVVEEAHARFNAKKREYEYHISTEKNPFSQDFAYQLHKRPDVKLMQKAADLLFDHKDFQCFSRSKTNVKTYHCKIKNASWKEEENSLVFTIAADRFLRNMVRAIVGTLLEVGFEKITIKDFERIILSKDRKNAGTSAPAHGLFLTKVIYPQDIFINAIK